MPSDDGHELATSIFLRAREIPPDDLEAFLEANCAGDEALRHAVESLLARGETTHALAAPAEATPSIPGYQVLQKLGEGGMGEVWLAQQDTPIRRQVAIKVIKAGMDTKHVIARFEAERQALAMMEHPNIAKVFEAGETTRGLPFFVMERVKGEPITTYADRHTLSIRERLELFMVVCDSVQHAHQKGIIHRDLKPTNVLVAMHAEQPMPKIIDFGVAKATAQPLTERTLYTAIGAVIGTPAYMSPEQAELTTVDVDTRTDVYSLGVILYELLVGALPLDARAMPVPSFDELRRRIREVEPARPSTRLLTLGSDSAETARLRGAEPNALRRALRGDLDWITMRALEKDRTRRYQSPSALAEDIGRHLRDEPVLAGPPNLRYRLAKFVRRHRVGVAAGAVVVATVVVGTTAATVGFVRARRAEHVAREEAETSKQVTRFLENLFEVSNPYESNGRTITVREILDRGAARIDGELPDRPEVRAQLLRTLGKVYRDLGSLDQAAVLLEKAVHAAERAKGAEDPGVAAALMELAIVTAASDVQQAKAMAERALSINTKALDPDHVDTGRAWKTLADIYWLTGERANEQDARDRALAILEKGLPPDDPDLASAFQMQAFFLRRQARYAEAAKFAHRALEVLEKRYGPDDPRLAGALNTLGNIQVLGRNYAEAEITHTRAFKTFERLFPSSVAPNLSYLANIKYRLGKLGEAAELLEPVARKWKTSPPDDSASTVEVLSTLALVQHAQGRPLEAQRTFDRAVGCLAKPGQEVYLVYLRALIAAVRGDRTQVLAQLRLLVSLGFGTGEEVEFFRDPEFTHFQGDPEFEAIVAEARARNQPK